jgi:hypothetical protein
LIDHRNVRTAEAQHHAGQYVFDDQVSQLPGPHAERNSSHQAHQAIIVAHGAIIVNIVWQFFDVQRGNRFILG